jgi:signal peptidase I
MADTKLEKVAKPGFFSFENMRSLTVLVIVIFALRHSVASPYHVPTASMEPTIKVGDRLLAFKLAYELKIPFTDIVVASWGTPKRGDIIVFKYPRDPDTDYVKRVVGLAGDELKVEDGVLFINGIAQSRVDHNQDRAILEDIEDNRDIKLLYRENLDGLDHWVMHNIATQRHFVRDPWPEPGATFKVPPDSVFVMGDNRDNSTDSRFWQQVPLSYVRGKALFVIWSIYSPEGQGLTLPSLRWSRFGASLY